MRDSRTTDNGEQHENVDWRTAGKLGMEDRRITGTEGQQENLE